MKKTKQILHFIVLMACANLLQAQATIDNSLLVALQHSPTVHCLVIMREQADLSAANTLLTKEEKTAFVYDRLTQKAAQTKQH